MTLTAPTLCADVATALYINAPTNKVTLTRSPNSSAPKLAVATVGWCYDTLLSGQTTALTSVSDVTWNGTQLVINKKKLSYNKGLLTAVTNATTTYIDTVTYTA